MTESYYINVFDEYRNGISNLFNANKTDIENCEKRKIAIKNEIEELSKQLPAFDDRKSREFSLKLKKAEQEFNDAKANISILSDSEYSKLKKEVEREAKTINDLESKFENLTSIIDNPETPKKEKSKAKAERDEVNNKFKSARSALLPLSDKLDKEEANRKILQDKEKKFKEVKSKYDAIREDEKISGRQNNKKNDENKERIQILKNEQKELIERSNKLKTQNEALQKSPLGDIETFKTFLTKSGYQTTHAEELYELLENDKHNLTINIEDFKLRKQHPKRDYFLKKIVTPALLTGGAVGVASGAIVASTFTASANKWLFLTISSNPVTNFCKVALVGAGIGAAAATATILAKDAITKQYYKNKYGNANTIIKGSKGEDFNNLLEIIKNDTNEILDLKRTENDNAFKKFGKFVKRTRKNIVNRNRIHHIEKVTKELIEKFNEIDKKTESVSAKAEALKPYYEKLKQINDFINDDIKNAKVFALLNCKNDNKNHSHKETIENLDIYTKLKMTIDKTKDLTEGDPSSIYKHQVKNNISEQQKVANELANGASVITSPLNRYEEILELAGQSGIPANKDIDSFYIKVVNGKAILNATFKAGNTAEYPVDDENVREVKSVDNGKNLSVTYKNGNNKKISTRKETINYTNSGEITVLSELMFPDTMKYLIGKRYPEETIKSLRDALYSTKYNIDGTEKTDRKEFKRTKVFREHKEEYEKIIKEVIAIIKNPKLKNSNTDSNNPKPKDSNNDSNFNL